MAFEVIRGNNKIDSSVFTDVVLKMFYFEKSQKLRNFFENFPLFSIQRPRSLTRATHDSNLQYFSPFFCISRHHQQKIKKKKESQRAKSRWRSQHFLLFTSLLQFQEPSHHLNPPSLPATRSSSIMAGKISSRGRTAAPEPWFWAETEPKRVSTADACLGWACPSLLLSEELHSSSSVPRNYPKSVAVLGRLSRASNRLVGNLILGVFILFWVAII